MNEAHEPEVEVRLPRKIWIADIVRKVSETCGVRVADIQGHCRCREYTRPRQYAMVLSRELTTSSLPEIGRRIGGRDHTTVVHALWQIPRLASQDPDMEALLNCLRGHFDPDGEQRRLIRQLRKDRGSSYSNAAG